MGLAVTGDAVVGLLVGMVGVIATAPRMYERSDAAERELESAEAAAAASSDSAAASAAAARVRSAANTANTANTANNLNDTAPAKGILERMFVIGGRFAVCGAGEWEDVAPAEAVDQPRWLCRCGVALVASARFTRMIKGGPPGTGHSSRSR